MDKKYHLIYRTTNLETGKFYIGMHSTNNLDDGYLGSGLRLRSSIAKYGKENHQREILELLDSRDALAKREREIVNDALLADQMCMNLCKGGEGGGLPGDKNPFFGKQHTVESRRKISEAGKGLVHTDEAKEKISKRFKDQPLTEDHKTKIKASNKGKVQNKSPEALRNIEAAKCRPIMLGGFAYGSIKEAAEILELNRSMISRMLKKEENHATK